MWPRIKLQDSPQLITHVVCNGRDLGISSLWARLGIYMHFTKKKNLQPNKAPQIPEKWPKVTCQVIFLRVCLFVCFSPFLLFDILIKSLQVWARVVCFCAFLMVPSQPVLLPPLGLYPWNFSFYPIINFANLHLAKTDTKMRIMGN